MSWKTDRQIPTKNVREVIREAIREAIPEATLRLGNLRHRTWEMIREKQNCNEKPGGSDLIPPDF